MNQLNSVYNTSINDNYANTEDVEIKYNITIITD